MRCSDGSASGNSWRCGLCAEYQEQAEPWQNYSGVFGPMFRGNRLFVLAVGLVLCGQAPSAEGVPNPSPTPKNQAANGAQDPERNPKPLAVTIVESSEEAKTGEARQAKGDEHDARDLDAQIRAADAAEKQIAPSWLAAILSTFGTLLIIWTLALTRKANAISRDANRAWLSISVSDTGKFWINAEELEFYFDVTLQNHGDSPANKAFCKGFLVLGDPQSFNLPALEEIVPVKSTDAECIVFPNSSPMGTEIIAKLRSPFPAQSEINLMVVCRYRIVGHKDWRSSTRTFNLRPVVEFYSSSGRFQNGLCNLSIPENQSVSLALNLKERNDYPPTAT